MARRSIILFITVAILATACSTSTVKPKAGGNPPETPESSPATSETPKAATAQDAPPQPAAPLAPTKKPESSGRLVTGSRNFRFYLQPHSNATIQVEGKSVYPYKIKTDKTLALVQIKAPTFEDGQGFHLRIEHPGYRTFNKTITNQKSNNGQSITFVLNKTDSKHRFLHRWHSGRLPKSVTFIDNRQVVLPHLDDKHIDVIHILTGKKVKIAPPPSMAIKRGFVETVPVPAHNEFWVSQLYTHSVHVFDIKTLKYKKTIPMKGQWVKVLRYDEERDVVYASNWKSGDITVIDADTHKVKGNLNVGGVPRGMQLSADGKFLWVAQFGGGHDTDGVGKIVEYDLAAGKVARRFGQPGSKRHIVRHNNRFFISDMSHAWVETYNSTSGQFLKKVEVYSKPNTIALTPDAKWLYVSCRGPNNPDKGFLHKGYHMGQVHVINTATMEMTEFWEGGNQPTGLAVSPDGRYVVSSDFLDNTIRVYERL